MKKVLLLSVLILLVGGAAFALDVSLVPKVGAGVGLLTGNDWQDVIDSVNATNSVRFMWTAGAFLDVGLIDVLAIQAGAAYTQSGGAYNYDLAGATINGTAKADLLEVPLLLRLRLGGGAGGFYLLAGPEAMWVLGDLVVDEEGVTTDNAVSNQVIWAATGGLGYSFTMMGGNALVELRYTHSFSDIDFDAAGPQTWNFNNAYLTVGYALPLFGGVEDDFQ